MVGVVEGRVGDQLKIKKRLSYDVLQTGGQSETVLRVLI